MGAHHLWEVVAGIAAAIAVGVRRLEVARVELQQRDVGEVDFLEPELNLVPSARGSCGHGGVAIRAALGDAHGIKQYGLRCRCHVVYARPDFSNNWGRKAM